jgi:hypothetical protein
LFHFRHFFINDRLDLSPNDGPHLRHGEEHSAGSADEKR